MENFLGEVRLFAGNYAPAGWAFCDGSLQSIASNDALYVLLGTTYGGDGVSTFGLPDLRGRVPIHQGTLSQFGTNYQLGQSGGVTTVTLTPNQVPTHSHTLAASAVAGTANTPAGNVVANAPAGYNLYRETNGTVGFIGSSIGPAGGGQPHDNMQPYTAINYIIALQGIFPTQS